MTFKIKGSDLGVKNCDFVAAGETPQDVVEQMVTHLREEHDIRMPDEDVILTGGEGEWEAQEEDAGAAVIVKRLREALELDGGTATDVSDVAGPMISGRPTSG